MQGSTGVYNIRGLLVQTVYTEPVSGGILLCNTLYREHNDQAK